MDVFKSFKQRVINASVDQFEPIALEVFQYQAKNNPVYANYINFLGKNPQKVSEIAQIPFLPIELFKYHKVINRNWNYEVHFESSGTTGSQTSTHFIHDLDFYLDHSKSIFERNFGPVNDLKILALLPSYLERKHSSLIAMVKHFIDHAAPGSGFYMNNYDELLDKLMKRDQKTLLWGVTFALLELAHKHPSNLSEILLIETGGMKGRGEELTRDELYSIMEQKLGVKKMYAEYGMTELLSQAYARNGIFKPPSSMRVLIRDLNDPFEYIENGRTGGINIVDLANIHSCAFIETKDLGRLTPEGGFEVLGRFDNSDLRGCNLMF